MSQANAEALSQMMVAVVQSGTGPPPRSLASPWDRDRADAAGRPTARLVHRLRTAENPQVAVAVVVLDGGNLGAGATGGEICAPIARTSPEAALNR